MRGKNDCHPGDREQSSDESIGANPAPAAYGIASFDLAFSMIGSAYIRRYPQVQRTESMLIDNYSDPHGDPNSRQYVIHPALS